MEIEDLISLRGDTHGDFTQNAIITQQLKSVFRKQTNWGHLHEIEKEALDQIALKISRILSGDPGYDDHWLDIQGYCERVLNYDRPQ